MVRLTSNILHNEFADNVDTVTGDNTASTINNAMDAYEAYSAVKNNPLAKAALFGLGRYATVPAALAIAGILGTPSSVAKDEDILKDMTSPKHNYLYNMTPIQNYIANSAIESWGLRDNGDKKGLGYFGLLPINDPYSEHAGGIMSEIGNDYTPDSIWEQVKDNPNDPRRLQGALINPYLGRKDLEWLINNEHKLKVDPSKLTQEDRKEVKHLNRLGEWWAEDRKEQGRSGFIEDNERPIVPTGLEHYANLLKESEAIKAGQQGKGLEDYIRIGNYANIQSS